MRKALAVTALLLLATMAFGATAQAKKKSQAKQSNLAGYCSPSGDYCTSVTRENGRIKLVLRTFSFRGGYKICVKPKEAKGECRGFRLTETRNGVWASRIDLRFQFHVPVDGRSTVSWRHAGSQLGKTLSFNLG